MNTGVYIFDYATAGPDYPSGVNNYWFIPQELNMQRLVTIKRSI